MPQFRSQLTRNVTMLHLVKYGYQQILKEPQEAHLSSKEGQSRHPDRRRNQEANRRSRTPRGNSQQGTQAAYRFRQRVNTGKRRSAPFFVV